MQQFQCFYLVFFLLPYTAKYCIATQVLTPALFVFLNNLIEKKKFNEIFKVTSSWQIFYASVIAGGINGVLVVYLPPKLYRFASVIVIAVLFEIINGISNNTYSTNYTFISNIVRDIFLIFFIIDLYKKLFKDYTKNKKNDSIDEIEFDELLGVTLLSSIVLNIGIVTTRTGINSILNL